MGLFSYVVTHDTGFAPNPFFGRCTVACCKPKIRKSAKPGDWIVGLTGKGLGNKVVYAMQVVEKLTFRQYWPDPRFQSKKPSYETGLIVDRCGDNIYEPFPDEDFRQLRSMHSNGESQNLLLKKIDLDGQFVLIAQRFAYFGSAAVDLPGNLSELIVGRNHRSKFSEETLRAFKKWIEQQPSGIRAQPRTWPASDFSWRDSGGPKP